MNIPQPYIESGKYKHVPDPRLLESLGEAIAPGFDSAGDSLSDPLPPHRPRLTQRDRQIYETCAVGGIKTLMPHQDSSSIPYHLQIKNIMFKAQCSDTTQAKNLADTFSILDASEKMTGVFCRWARIKGVDETLDYLYKFVVGVEEAENPLDPLDKAVEYIEPGFNPIQGLDQIDLDDDDPEVLAAEYEQIPESKDNGSTMGYHVFEDFGRPAQLLSDILDRCETYEQRAWFWDWSEEADEEEVETVHSRLFSWEARQSKKFKELIDTARSADLIELGKLANKVHEQEITLTRAQTGVFWTEFNSRKEMIKPYLGTVAKAFIRKIVNSDGHLGTIGSWLYKVQHGEIKVTPVPSDVEWRVVWGEYYQMKERNRLAGELANLRTELFNLKHWDEIECGICAKATKI